jgi:hypothetical protein
MINGNLTFTRKRNIHSRFYSALLWTVSCLLKRSSLVRSFEAHILVQQETCTQRRNNISPIMLEALQILKFIYKQDRLKFMEDLMAMSGTT